MASCPDCSGGENKTCWENTPGYEEWKKKWEREEEEDESEE